MRLLRDFFFPLVAIWIMLTGVAAVNAQQQYQQYNGRNYRRFHANGRSYRPCLAFYPVDFLLNMNAGAPGDAITIANLNASMQGNFISGSTLADVNAVIGASMFQIPGSVHVQGETGDWGCGYETQSMQHNNINAKTVSEMHWSGGDQAVIRLDGLIYNGARSPFDSGVTMDNITILARGGHSQTIQLQNATSFHCADDQGILTGVSLENSSVPTGGTTSHSPCIALNVAGYYYYTMVTDNSNANPALRIASLNIYDLAKGPPSIDTLVGSVSVLNDGAAAAYYAVRWGNGETGYSVGTKTGFQYPMVSWTDVNWPNIPH